MDSWELVAVVEGSSRLKLQLYRSAASSCGVKVVAEDVEYTLDGELQTVNATIYFATLAEGWVYIGREIGLYNADGMI